MTTESLEQTIERLGVEGYAQEIKFTLETPDLIKHIRPEDLLVHPAVRELKEKLEACLMELRRQKNLLDYNEESSVQIANLVYDVTQSLKPFQKEVKP